MVDCPACGWSYRSEAAASQCEERDRAEDLEARQYFRTKEHQ